MTNISRLTARQQPAAQKTVLMQVWRPASKPELVENRLRNAPTAAEFIRKNIGIFISNSDIKMMKAASDDLSGILADLQKGNYVKILDNLNSINGLLKTERALPVSGSLEQQQFTMKRQGRLMHIAQRFHAFAAEIVSKLREENTAVIEKYEAQYGNLVF